MNDSDTFEGDRGVMQTPTSTNAETASSTETQNAPPSSAVPLVPEYVCRGRSEGFSVPALGRLMREWVSAVATRTEKNAFGTVSQRGLSSAHFPLHPFLAGRGPRIWTSLLSFPKSAVFSTVYAFPTRRPS